MKRKSGFIFLCTFWLGMGALAWWRGGTAAWFLFYSIAVIIVYLTLFWFLTLRYVRAKGYVEHADYVVHDHVSVKSVIQYRSWLPVLWLQVEQVWLNRVRNEKVVYKQLFFPLFRRKLVVSYQLEDVKRGPYELIHTDVVTGDLFGWMTKRESLHIPLHFTVYPKPLMMIYRTMDKPNDSATHSRQTVNHHNLNLFSHVRDYVHGDPMNRIHWKSSAKANVLKTKEIDRSMDRPFIIFLDSERTSYLTEQPIPVFEKCVQVTASLIHDAERHRLPIRLLCNNKQLYRTPLSVSYSLRGLLAFLATVCPDGTVPLYEMMSKEAARLPMNSSILCVTTNVNELMFTQVQQLRTKRIHVHFLLIYSTVALSWHQLYWKQQFEAIGCSFHTIQHLEMDWSGQGGNDVAGA